VSTTEELEQLYSTIDTGDMLLFESIGATGRIARSCTGSQWDHVAIIVNRKASDGPREGPGPKQSCPAAHKCADGYCTCVAEAEDILEVMEATAAGVHIYGMDDRLAKTVHHHRHVAVLKRNVPITAEQCAKLETFVRKVSCGGWERASIVRCCAQQACDTHLPHAAVTLPSCDRSVDEHTSRF
jgi:hypothetical protein